MAIVMGVANGPTLAAEPEGRIAKELRELREAVELLGNSFGVLCGRISPVLDNRPREGLVEGKGDASPSPLGEELRLITEKVRRLTYQVGGVSDSIQL